MRKIIFLENKNSSIRTFFLIAILELLTVSLIACLSIDQSPGVYISIASGILIIIIIILLLINIKMAIPLLIVFLPIHNIMFSQKGSKFEVAFLLSNLLVVLVAICLLLCNCIVKNRTSIDRKNTAHGYLSLLLFTLVAFSILSILWSPDLIVGLNYCIKIISNFLMYLSLVVLIKEQRDVLMVVKTLVLTTVIAAIAAFVSVLPIDSLRVNKVYSLTKELTVAFSFQTFSLRAGGLVNAHIVSLFMIFGILYITGLMSQRIERKEKIVLFLIIIFLSLATLFTTARGPLISLFLAMIFLICSIKYFNANLFRNLFIFVICATFLIGIFIVTHGSLADYSKPYLPAPDTQYEKRRETSFSDRLYYWKKAYTAVANNNAYVHGLGVGGSSFYLHPPTHAHNIYLSILFDFGLIGLSIFFAIISISLTKIIVTIRKLKEGFAKAMLLSTTGCILALSITSLMDYDYSFDLVWLLMGIGVAIYRYAISTQKESFGECESSKTIINTQGKSIINVNK